MNSQELPYPMDDTIEETPWHRKMMASVLNFSALSKLLRLLGAGVIVAALSVYLLQGWQSGDDIQRYLLLLAHTVLLAGIGFACSHVIKETKGARLFLSLALVSVPVNFAVLGGLLYSQVQWDAAFSTYPAFAKWQADSLSAALITAAGAALVLLPILWIGFLALARRSAGALTGLFFITNVTLLLPVRSPTVMGITLLTLMVVVSWQLAKLARRDSTSTSTEGRFARSLMFLPLGIMAARGFSLYAADAFMMAAVAFGGFMLMRQVSIAMPTSSHWRRFLEQLQLIPAALASFWFTAFVDQSWSGLSLMLLPIFGLCFSGMVIETSLRSPANGPAFRRFASVVMMLFMVINLTLFPGVGGAMLCIAAGLGVLIYGFSAQQRVVFTFGLLTLLIGLGYQLHFAVIQFDLGSWGALAALGVSAILAGSLLERHGPVVKQRVSRWVGEYRSWEY